MITEFIPFLKNNDTTTPSCAIFLSGSGTNAEKVMDYQLALPQAHFQVSVLVTDAPDRSRALEIGEKYKIPVVAVDLREFYLQKGLSSTSLKTEIGRTVREEWTQELRRLLKPYRIDFALLAGFVPLCNITSDFPCLNIHPGDLTIVDDQGQRQLVGLHQIPVEKAILAGHTSLRSSVILAEPFVNGGDNMDAGLILGISENISIDLRGYSLAQLKSCAAVRNAVKPAGGWNDALSEVASFNLERLKKGGDWSVFPRVADEFATGCFVKDLQGQLYYRLSKYIPVETVVYGSNFKEVIFSFS